MYKVYEIKQKYTISVSDTYWTYKYITREYKEKIERRGDVLNAEYKYLELKRKGNLREQELYKNILKRGITTGIVSCPYP